MKSNTHLNFAGAHLNPVEAESSVICFRLFGGAYSPHFQGSGKNTTLKWRQQAPLKRRQQITANIISHPKRL
jgi:hypothetical protein